MLYLHQSITYELVFTSLIASPYLNNILVLLCELHI